MKKKNFEHKIRAVLPGSIAEELELEPGDVLVAVNDHEIEDVFDYHYLYERGISDGSCPQTGRRGMGAGDRKGI